MNVSFDWSTDDYADLSVTAHVTHNSGTPGSLGDEPGWIAEDVVVLHGTRDVGYMLSDAEWRAIEEEAVRRATS